MKFKAIVVHAVVDMLIVLVGYLLVAKKVRDINGETIQEASLVVHELQDFYVRRVERVATDLVELRNKLGPIDKLEDLNNQLEAAISGLANKPVSDTLFDSGSFRESDLSTYLGSTSEPAQPAKHLRASRTRNQSVGFRRGIRSTYNSTEERVQLGDDGESSRSTLERDWTD